jgi:polar amino acid transport system substrate-binding protein
MFVDRARRGTPRRQSGRAHPLLSDPPELPRISRARPDVSRPIKLAPVRRALLSALALLTLALAAAACGGSSSSSDTTTTTTGTAQAASCSKDTLELTTPGKLTIATDNPSFPPWFVGKKADSPWDPTTPPTKKGYEAGVAYAVAKKLGFTDGDVVWKVQQFTQLFKPGSKPYDFDINQVSYNPKRAKAVGFSDSYYDVEQAVVSYKGSKIANAKSLADLKDAKLGYQIGTTSGDAISETIKPSKSPNVYSDSNAVVAAIKAHQVDGIVVDFPTALYMSGVQIPNGLIVGRLPSTGGQQEHFGLVTSKGSSLIACLNKSLSELRADGTLKQLQQKWIAGGSPELQ